MPLVLQGEGHYLLSDIMNIEVTKDFVRLGPEQTRCQTEEYREDCISRKLRERALAQCSCTPFNLRSYYGDQVRHNSNTRNLTFNNSLGVRMFSLSAGMC